MISDMKNFLPPEVFVCGCCIPLEAAEHLADKLK